MIIKAVFDRDFDDKTKMDRRGVHKAVLVFVENYKIDCPIFIWVEIWRYSKELSHNRYEKCFYKRQARCNVAAGLFVGTVIVIVKLIIGYVRIRNGGKSLRAQ